MTGAVVVVGCVERVGSREDGLVDDFSVGLADVVGLADGANSSLQNLSSLVGPF